MSRTGFRTFALIIAASLAAALIVLVVAVPTRNEARDWTGQYINGGWMAWTFPVALFFWSIAALLLTFLLIAIRRPETPRIGILRIETTRGDRLFISLLGSAFICLAWLFAFGGPLWWALPICLLWALAVFRWV